MDEVQMELKDELTDQHEELKIEYEPSDELSVLNSIENIDMPYEEIEIKDEPIDKGFISASIESTNMEISSYIPIIKQEVSETNETALNNVTVVTEIMTNSKTFDEPEDLEESGIFVKSETDIKPEIIFGFSESDSNHTMSTVSNDPLDITVHEEKSKAKIKCFHCPALFDAALDLRDLTKHLNTEHKNHNQAKNTSSTQKMCPLCPALFNERSDFNKHFSTEHAVSIQRKITSPTHKMTALELKKHFTTEHEDGKQAKIPSSIHQMTVVKNDPLDTTNLNKHFSTAHETSKQLNTPDSKRKKDYKCSICLKVSTKSHDLRRHLTRIHAFECQFCPLKFVLKRDMHEHVKFVHSYESQISAKNILNNGINVEFKCQSCSIKFMKKEDLKEHIRLIHSLKCQFCSSKFLKKKDLDGHVSFVHAMIKCQFCSSKFVKEDDVNKHITFIHEDKTFMPHSPNKCVCYHVIESTNNFERQTVHEFSTAHEANIQSTQEGKIEIKIVCHLCSAIFDARSDFNKHFSSKHAVKKSVQDDFINEKRKKLKSEKTIQCHLCHAKFTRRGNRKQHISNVHEGIKPHQCLHCPAKFAFKTSLKRHLIEHKSML